MKSKEEIFNSYRDDSRFSHMNKVLLEKKDCLCAMDDFAKEMCIDFVDWLLENTEIIKEEKITLFRYHDRRDGWGNYVLNDIHLVYLEELNNS